MIWQEIVVWAIVAASVLLVARRFSKRASRKGACGCGCGAGASASASARKCDCPGGSCTDCGHTNGRKHTDRCLGRHS